MADSYTHFAVCLRDGLDIYSVANLPPFFKEMDLRTRESAIVTLCDTHVCIGCNQNTDRNKKAMVCFDCTEDLTGKGRYASTMLMAYTCGKVACKREAQRCLNEGTHTVAERGHYEFRYCCASCGTHRAERMRKCSGCLVVHYCSVKCQSQDWKSWHAKECKNTLVSQ